MRFLPALSVARIGCVRATATQRAVVCLIGSVALLMSGCATTSSPRVDIEELLKPDPRLPRREVVEAVGTLALQQLTALSPKLGEVFAGVDLNTATATIVTTMFRNPPEQIAASPHLFEITAFALSHQWGLTQSALDYVTRYERLITSRREKSKRKQAELEWSNVFLALGSLGYQMGNINPYAMPAQRLSNELGIARNEQSLRINQLMSEYHQKRIETFEEVLLRVNRLKQELVSYSNLLEIYRGWLLRAQVDQGRDMPPAARRILEVKATF